MGKTQLVSINYLMPQIKNKLQNPMEFLYWIGESRLFKNSDLFKNN